MSRTPQSSSIIVVTRSHWAQLFTPKVPLIHFIISSNYGFGSQLPNSTALYLHSKTSTPKNSKSHNPTAQSGFISLSWLYLVDFFCVIVSRLPLRSPCFVLLKSSFVDSSSAVFCCFSVRTCQLTWRWVDLYTSLAFLPPRHHLTCAHTSCGSSMQHSLLLHKPNNTQFYTLKYLLDHCLLLSPSGIRPILFLIIYFAWSCLSLSLSLYFSLVIFFLQHTSLTLWNTICSAATTC